MISLSRFIILLPSWHLLHFYVTFKHKPYDIYFLLYLFWQKREYLQYALVRSYIRFLIKRILWNKIFLERKLFIVILIYSRIMSVKLKEIFMFVLSTTLSYSMWVKYLRFNIEYILYYALLSKTLKLILVHSA